METNQTIENKHAADARNRSAIGEKALTEQRLANYLRSETSGIALEIFFRDNLTGGYGKMANPLIWARADAKAIRDKADDIENRAVLRLVEDVITEWKPAEIYAAIDKAEGRA